MWLIVGFLYALILRVRLLFRPVILMSVSVRCIGTNVPEKTADKKHPPGSAETTDPGMRRFFILMIYPSDFYFGKTHIFTDFRYNRRYPVDTVFGREYNIITEKCNN